MAGAVIGALRVVLGADTAALDKGLKDSQSKLASFGAGMATAGAAVGAAMLAMGAAVAVGVRHAITEADKLGKMSQKIGIPVEQLSALSLAAALSDVSMESLGKSVGKLSKAMVEAAAKPTSDAANAFKALGVSVTESDGKLKSSNTVLQDIAGRFEGLKDGAGKTAVSMAIFGKSGAEMIPLLNAGKAGLKEMTDEAAQLGIVIDNHTAKSAEAFNDNLTRLGKAKDGIILKITLGMLPALENLSANMVRVAKDSDALTAAGGAIGSMMTGLFSIIEHVRLGWQRLGVEWQALREFMQTDIFSGKLTENWKKFTEVGAESTRQFEALRATMETAHLADAFGAISVKTAEGAKTLKEFNYAAMAGANAVDHFLDSTKKALAAQNADTQAVGAAIGVKERLRVVLQANQLAMDNQIKMTPTLAANITAVGVAAEASAIKLAGMQMTQANLLPSQLFAQQLSQINLLYATGAINADTYNLAVMRLQFPSLTTAIQQSQDLRASFDQMATSMANNFSSAFANVIVGSQKAAEAFKAFGKQVLVMVIEMITKMLILKAIQVAIGFATGGTSLVIGEVAGAALKDAGLSGLDAGFAGGADFRVPGGVSMTDNMPMAMNLAAGERVRVEPNRYGEGDTGDGGSRVMNVMLQGVSFSRDQVRELLKTAEQLAGDGFKVNLSPA